MSEVKPEKKGKNKNKKKSKSNSLSKEVAPIVTNSDNVLANSVQLPKTFNESTFINDVQVTLTKQEPQPEVKAATSSKKKKKNKKDSAKSNEPVNKQNEVKAAESPANNFPPLNLNFTSKGYIGLPHLPEITVTKMEEAKLEPTKLSDEPVNNSVGDTSTAKKKKKKKKKKTPSLDENKVEEEKSQPSDPANSEPTYVKLQAQGDNYVLLVSHESFANGAQSGEKSSNQSSTSTRSASETMTLPFRNSSDFAPNDINRPWVSLSPVDNENNVLESKQGAPCNATINRVGDNIAPENTTTAASDGNSKKGKAIQNKPQVSGAKSENQKPVKDAANTGKSTKIVNNNTASKTRMPKEKQQSQVSLFSHLPQYKSQSVVLRHLESNEELHPSILAVGAKYAEGIISGSNARCVAILSALKDVIHDYNTPPNKELSRDLDAKIQECVSFISKCRPLSVSMSNAVKVLKHYINSIPSNTSDDEAKSILCDQITKFVKEEIYLANEAISTFTTDKIVDGDVVLTYAYSSVVKDALCKAFRKNKKFRVVVVDSRPKMEGRVMLKRLLNEGIECSYTLISGISHLMKEVTKVIIGAHGLQANGYVMSRVGSSQIALVAAFYNVPFLVCCETYKFCERVHTDSFVYNELGDPESFLVVNNVRSTALESWKDMEKLQLLNILYDITAPHLVSMVVTEKGMLPCTSVPVVLRVRHAGSHE